MYSNAMRTRKIDNINYKSLLKYGFILKDNTYYYEKNIVNDKFKVVISIKDNFESKVIDNILDEEYILVDVDNAVGSFVGKVREEYELLLRDIINNSTSTQRFKYKQTNDVLRYIKKTYQDNIEYLWEKFPNCGAIRNKINNKWYGLIVSIESNKIGLDSNEEIEIIDIRYQSKDINSIIDNKNIFPGYHMNKKNWITVILNNSLDNNIIYSLIDNSYEISLKKS